MPISKLNRRDFLKLGLQGGGLLLGVSLPRRRALAHVLAAPDDGSSDPTADMFSPSVYLGIADDGAVTVVAHRSEMGQGIRTGLAQTLADELEADWSRIHVVQADGDPKYGNQDTDGSRSIRHFFTVMREAGAVARTMLEQAAAQTWNVDASQCRAVDHTVVHEPSGRRLGFGALARLAEKLPVPKKTAVKLKPRSAFRYIGRGLTIVDMDAMTHGRAVYGIDVRLPGMKYASIERCPVVFGRVKSLDASAAEAMRGVEKIVRLEAPQPPAAFKPLGGVAVIADNTWTAQQARRKLKIEWDYGPNRDYDSARFRKTLESTARKPGKVVRHAGDVDAAFAQAAHTLDALYYAPHMDQAPMEPMAAVAWFKDGRYEIWAATQDPQGAREVVAKAVGLKPKDVTVHTTLLGGGFGRKSKPDFIVEAALLSKAAGAPVQVLWSREDAVRHGYYHTVSAQYLKAALDASNKPVAWLHRTVFPPIGSTFKAGLELATKGELGLGFLDMPYDIPNIRLENGKAPALVRIGWLRSVANVYHAFAICSFADELAAAAGEDPVEHLLKLIGPARHIDLAAQGADYVNYGDPLDKYPIDTGRLSNVLRFAAEKGDWRRSVHKGHGLGVAVHRSFLSYIAAIVEVSVDQDGTIAVPRVDLAVDCGTVVNPDRVRAQMEGAVIYGLSAALYSKITAKRGAIVQSNFHDYLVPRIDITPDTRIHIVDSDAPPAGVGEPGVPPVSPALANAVFAATGKRVRELPITVRD